jgi:RNA polymerase sigma-70 factor (ECF subfamily)
VADDPDLLDVRRVLDGRVEAFEGIVRRWQRPLVNLAYRLCRDPGLAEDLAQEAFVKAYRGLAGWRAEGRFSTWLFALALNHYRSMLRRVRPPTVVLDEALHLAVPHSGERELEAEQKAQAVRQAVAALPARYREAVALYYLRGVSVEEVARSLRVPEGTLKARLHRAREMLRRKLVSLQVLPAEE